jgi:hypothetical protein
MNLYKFKYFTYVYFIFLLIILFISLFLKKYDFLLGVYIFTVPILIVGFITNWINNSDKNIYKKFFNDFFLHWVPFLSFMYIIFIIKPTIVNLLWFWIGYIFILLTLIIYFIINGNVNGLENNYNLKTYYLISIFIFTLIVSTIFVFLKTSK